VLGRDTLYTEALGFTVSLLPILARIRPEVVYVSEWYVARGLVRWRRRSGARFKLLVSNGGIYPPERFDGFDHVHQLTPHELERALDAGVPAERQTLLELGLPRDAGSQVPSASERERLREALGLPADRQVVLSVAALGAHKRISYLVREMAALPPPRPFLMLLGQREQGAGELIAEGRELLGEGGFATRTVAPERVSDYYAASDVFVLSSLWEAFGRVMVEALAHGLPCVVHDGPTQRFVLGDQGGLFGDFTREGGLAGLLPTALAAAGDRVARERRRHAAQERFSWDALAPRYVEMMRRCAASGS
jgi:1,2-diacylglycerol 3-alpha-glucosyltransferase